jgi:hypothetical protein
MHETVRFLIVQKLTMNMVKHADVQSRYAPALQLAVFFYIALLNLN